MTDKIKNEIDRELSPVVFVTKERLEKLSRGKDKKMRLNKKFIAFGVAAAVVAGSAVTVGAVSEWDYSRLIKGFFPKSAETAEEAPAHAEITTFAKIDESLTGIPLTVTSGAETARAAEIPENAVKKLDGIMQEIPKENVISTFTDHDVTLDGFIFDGKQLMVSATFRRKDGKPFDDKETERYETFFELEGDVSFFGGSTRMSPDADGSMQALFRKDIEGVEDKTPAKITVSYLLKDPETLKKPRSLDDIDPAAVIDKGTVSAEIELDICDKVIEKELTVSAGDTVNARLTPASVEVTFPGGKFSESEAFHLSDITVYGKNGETLIGPGDFSGGSGDETGLLKGYGFYFAGFTRILDINEVAGIKCGDYTWGEVPAE